MHGSVHDPQHGSEHGGPGQLHGHRYGCGHIPTIDDDDDVLETGLWDWDGDVALATDVLADIGEAEIAGAGPLDWFHDMEEDAVITSVREEIHKRLSMQV